VVLLIRSVVFNVAFYLNTLTWVILAIPTFLMPRWGIVEVAKLWGRTNLLLLRWICGIKVEWRGLEKLPRGSFLVAAKHQSAWETFALLWMFEDPTFILKRELKWIPLFGWLAVKAQMIPVDRGAGAQALSRMAKRARFELGRGRQIVIFPEGTRRPPGAEPRYKFGVAYLYSELDVPCVPIALNSGLFWPRRSVRRFPGTVLVEILDPITPGLTREAFAERLRHDIETATARLVAEGLRQTPGDESPPRMASGAP
jgi:1-acyl-sn-glycerol-3-phosphate acyltransferase